MTIKEWFYRHTNVTLMLLASIYCYFAWKAGECWRDERWGYAVASCLIAMIYFHWCLDWWRKHQ